MLPKDTRENLAAFGAVLTPDMAAGTYAALTPLALRVDPAATTITRDCTYGAHPKQRLDIYAPKGAKGAPVVVFLHGGGFARGDKGGPDDVFFANFGAWAVSAGFVGVAMTYRLVPEVRWPDGAADVAAAVAWLVNHIAEYGGDPAAIILTGQSAGAINIADYLANRGGKASSAVKGAVLMSGLYDFQGHEPLYFEAGYFGEDPAMRPGQSSLPALVHAGIPILFSVSELDPPQFHQQVAKAAAAWVAEYGHLPSMLHLAGQNHISPALFIGAEGDRLGPALADFVAQSTEVKTP